MFKKFIASVVMLATVVSSTAYAAQVGPDQPYSGSTQATDVIQNLSTDTTTINPNAGEEQTITFTLTEESQIHAFVDTNPKAYLATYQTTSAGTVSYSWNGRDGAGKVVADGDYEVKIYAYDGTLLSDAGFADVTVDSSSVNPDAPVISDFEVDPSTFDPNTENADINFEIDRDSYVTVVVKNSNGTVIRNFGGFNGELKFDGDYTVVWDGRNATGNIVSDGTYTIEITAEDNSTGATSKATAKVTVDSDNGNFGSELIDDLELDPSDEWNPVDEDLEITFDLTDEVEVLLIEAVHEDGRVIEIADEDDADEGDQEFTWDGTRENGDYVEEGYWDIIVYADEGKDKERIEVNYEAPEIVEAFVTKTEFDNEQDEFTYLVFKVDEDAIATVEVYDGNKKEDTLMDEEDVDRNEWVVVKFDGTDDDGDELSEGDYEFRITVEGEGEGDEDEMSVDFEIEEDDVSSDKPNATNDYTDPVIFDDNEDTTMEIHFCIDEDAEIDLSIYEGKSASGKEEAELLEDVDFKKGCHTIDWNVEDEDGKMLKEDIYSWKLIAKDGSKKDTETGRFVVGEESDGEGNGGKNPTPPSAGDCGGYWDTQNVGNELCIALEWLKDEGIMTGNPDGSFRPYDAINRAEVLKVTLEAYSDEVTMLPANGSNFGFWDVEPNAWYASYVRTAKFYGMLHGYLNSTEARLSNTINRVELLKFMLEGADAFTTWEKPGYEVSYFADVNAQDPLHDWFIDYAGVSHQYGLYGNSNYLNPAALVTRGEAALVLYRMHNSGLIK